MFYFVQLLWPQLHNRLPTITTHYEQKKKTNTFQKGVKTSFWRWFFGLSQFFVGSFLVWNWKDCLLSSLCSVARRELQKMFKCFLCNSFFLGEIDLESLFHQPLQYHGISLRCFLMPIWRCKPKLGAPWCQKSHEFNGATPPRSRPVDPLKK